MAVGFKIADGYVEVHAKVDRASVRRSAQQAAGDVDNEGRKRSGSFMKWLFTPNPDIMQALSRPIAKIFSTPVLLGVAAAGVAALSSFLATAITTAILGGLAVGFIGLGAFALRENEKIKAAFDDMSNRINSSLTRAASPLIQPLVDGMNLVGNWFERMEPALGRIFKGVGPMIEPLINGFMGMLNNMLPGIERALPGIQAVVDALAVHMPGLGTAIGDFFATLAENKDLLTRVVGVMITWFDIMFKVAGPVLVYLMSHFAMMADAWNMLSGAVKSGASWFIDNVVPAWLKFAGVMLGIYTAIPRILMALGDGIKNFAVTAWNWIVGTFGKIPEFFSGLWGTVTSAISTAFTTVVAFFTAIPGQLWSALQALPGLLVSVFWAAFDAIGYAVGFAIGSWLNYLINVPKMIGSAFMAIWDAASQATSAAFAAIWLAIQTAWNTVMAFFTGIPPFLAALFVKIWDAGQRATNAALNFLVRTVPEFIGKILRFLAGLPATLAGIFTGAWQRAINATTEGGNKIWNFVRQLPGRIVKGFGDAGRLLYNVGQDIIRGLINGIGSMISFAIDAARRAAGNVLQGAKDALGIGSPSKVFAAEVGKWIPAGIAVGIEQNAGMPQEALNGLALPSTMGGSTAPAPLAAGDGGPTYIQNNITLNASNLGELQQLLDFMNGKLQGSSKAWQWAGNIYESQGAFQRGHA